MRIAHIAPEMVPFAKVGGLGDVVGSLPLAQAEAGHDVTVVLPGYRRILDDQGLARDGQTVGYRIDGHDVQGFVARFEHLGVRILLVGHDDFFDRPGVYGSREGSYGDNGLRFGWFAGAALSALRSRSEPPQAVIAHDWPAGLVPLLMRVHRYAGDPLESAASIQVIHNLAHQGVFPLDLAARLHIPPFYVGPHCLEAMGSLSMLKGGILAATKVVTVSPTYAEEIVWPVHGEGLDRVLLARGDDLLGILNGLDTRAWNPEDDDTLARPYSLEALEGKWDCKRALQGELGLRVDASIPLLGVVSRVDPQKGIDLIEHVAPSLVQRGAQIVLLGSGRAGMLDPLHGLASIWRESVSVNERFDEGLARRIYAASDFFLMPSRFEPCGLGQLVALRYGSIPIVRKTGGLADTVSDAGESPTTGNGFVFETPDPGGLSWASHRALDWYYGARDRLEAMRRAGMAEDNSWSRSARAYDRMLALAVVRERRRVLEIS